ncbi:PEP-CTERM sorting domain-containing protein [Dapis sp. BLCC M126]|uniref:PEP-CTERM sorting domain-containing protein n=1 Tax=Dapis sp. BLCC M126 TaxID=3400189 RepID=UPI003CF9B06E
MFKQLIVSSLSTIVGFSFLVATVKNAQAGGFVTEEMVIIDGRSETILDYTEFEFELPDFGPVCKSCPPNMLDLEAYITLPSNPNEDALVSEIFTGFRDGINPLDVFPQANDNSLPLLSDFLVGFPEELVITNNVVFGNVTSQEYPTALIADTTVGNLGQFFEGDDLEQVSLLFSNYDSDARIVISQHHVPLSDLITSDSSSVPEPGNILGLSLLAGVGGSMRKLKKRK